MFCGHRSLRTAAWLFVSVCVSNTFQVAQWSRIHLQCRKAEDTGLIPRSGRSPGEGNGCPLQYSYLENSMDKGTWQAIVHGFAESDTTQHAWEWMFLTHIQTTELFCLKTPLEKIFHDSWKDWEWKFSDEENCWESGILIPLQIRLIKKTALPTSENYEGDLLTPLLSQTLILAVQIHHCQ